MVRLRGGVATVALVLVAATGCELDNAGGAAGPVERPGGGGAAYAAAEALTVKGRAPKNNYDRDEFGSPWADTDSNSCDTRVISMLRTVMGLFSQRIQGVVGCA